MAKYYISATTSDGGVGNDSTGDGSAATPWATITKWKTTIFNNSLMTVTDEVVISGLIREPDGVVLNAIGYTWGTRYMKGFRQWLPSDGFPGAAGTQTIWQNNIQRARLTSAQVLTGASIVDTAGVGTINPTNTGLTSDQIDYLTWRYRDNMDKFGRHYGHRLYATAASAAIAAGDTRYKFNGTTLTMDLTGADTTVANWELCKRIAAILQFQNWQGFGPTGPALVDGITFDRAVNNVDGAYLASMENCYRTGFRNVTGYDGGHHNFGITGYSNDGCWMRNVVAMGQYGLGTSDNGGQGGNSMTGSGATDQTGFTWNAAAQTLSGTYSVVNGQQPLIPGQTITISGGTGTSVGQTAIVDYSVNATTFRLVTAITATDGAADIAFAVAQISRNNTIEDFDYYIYPPLGLTVTLHVAGVTRLTRGVGLSNVAPTSTDSTTCIYTGNRYRRGRVTWFPETMPASPGYIPPVSAGGRRSGWTTDVESPEAYPLLIEDVTFTNCIQIFSEDYQDCAFNRCRFDFHPSVRTVDTNNSGQFTLRSNNSGALVPATRFLITGSEFIFDLGGAASAASAAFSTSASGNNQTAWTYTASTRTLSKGGGLSNCPIPRPGTIICVTGGTGVVAAPYTVESATTTAIVLTTTITATDGAADIAFDVSMAEMRVRSSTLICTGLRTGATVTSARFSNTGNSGVQGRFRGPLMDIRGCIVGFDKVVTGITNVLFVNDQAYTDGQSFGDRRKMSGNVYMNVAAGEFSDVTAAAMATALLFLNRTTGVDRTGYADNGGVLMNAPVDSRMFVNSYPYTNPPIVTGAGGFSGVNGNRFSGQPGGYQYGRSIYDRSAPRGRGR